MPFLVGPKKFPGTGGTQVLLDSGYYIHTFTESGTFSTDSRSSLVCDLLVVGGGAGGGSGGGHGRGGGGAGSSVYVYKWKILNLNSSFPITVGDAGTTPANVPEFAPSGTSGGISIFNSPGNNGIPQLTSGSATIGGRGGSAGSSTGGGNSGAGNPNPQGSAGGASGASRWGSASAGTGANVYSIGYDGGNGAPGHGGGGAGGAGGSAIPGTNTGGDGVPISAITENPLDYAGVGGSGNGTGGSSDGIFANSTTFNSQLSSSPVKYGHGGSSGTGPAMTNNTTAGGGVVIVRYLI